MESHLSRQYTLAELEPGWPEDLSTKRLKSSPRMQGSMMMALRRVSRNPENSRVYAHGDPVSLIDWKAYARTDELIIREHRDEASAKIIIVVDIADTMRWPEPEAVKTHGDIDPVSQKIEVAIRIALYLAHAHLTMGDLVTIACVNGAREIQMKWSPRSAGDVLGMYELCVKRGFFEGIKSLMIETNQVAASFDVVWMLSDFLGQSDLPEAQKLLNVSDWPAMQLSARHFRLIHLFSCLESNSQWMSGATSYRDEAQGNKVYLGDQLKQENQWHDQIDAWKSKVRSAAKLKGGAYLAIDDRTKVGDLFHWLTTEALI